MRRLSKYELWVSVVFAVGIFPSKIVSATDVSRQLAILGTAGKDSNAEKKIPIGFKLERYTRLWEHNPFVLALSPVHQSHPSPFDKLFLTSWLKDAGKDVIFVQNSETHAEQRVTAEPNEQNLRLVEVHPNRNPQFVQAVISDGKDNGMVKFRIGTQPAAPQTTEMMGTRKSTATDSAPSLARQANLPTAQASEYSATAPPDKAAPHRIYPGVPRVHVEGAGSAP